MICVYKEYISLQKLAYCERVEKDIPSKWSLRKAEYYTYI
jgi:hypothetical protein